MTIQPFNESSIKHRRHLVFVIHGLPMGGAEKFLISLLNHLVNQGKRPVLILLSQDVTLINELHRDIVVKIIHKKHKLDFLLPIRVRKVLLEEKPDLIICINPYSFFIARIPFLFNSSFHFCLSPHSTIPFSFRNYLQNYIYMLSLCKRDMVICLCEMQKSYLKTNYPFASRFVSIINNGIDFSHFNHDAVSIDKKEHIKSASNILPNDKVIVLVARITAEKRHVDAIYVVAKINQSSETRHHLLIVGDGPPELVAALKNTVAETRQDSFIHFLGSQKDVRPFYSVADLFVLTSFSETFSIAVIEAFAFGVPVAITDVGGASEMVIAGLNGSLTKPKDIDGMAMTWETVLNTKHDHDAIIKSAQEKYDLSTMLFKYEVAFA